MVQPVTHPVRQLADGAQGRHGPLRRTLARTVVIVRSRPRRGDAHRRQSGGLRRAHRVARPAHGARLWALRRHARRAAGALAERAVRAHHSRRTRLCPRRRRRQGAGHDPGQGIRDGPARRRGALQREVHPRGRGGGRVGIAHRLLQDAWRAAPGGRDPRLGHQHGERRDALADHRVARAVVLGDRSDRPQPRPPFGPLRRRRGQSDQCALQAHCQRHRCGRAHHPAALLRRCGRADPGREGDDRPCALRRGGLQAGHRRRRGVRREGLLHAGAQQLSADVRRLRHLGRLHGRGLEDRPAVEGLRQAVVPPRSASRSGAHHAHDDRLSASGRPDGRPGKGRLQAQRRTLRLPHRSAGLQGRRGRFHDRLRQAALGRASWRQHPRHPRV